MATDDDGHEQDFAGLIGKACNLPASQEPRCLVHPEGDRPFAVAGTNKGQFMMLLWLLLLLL